MKVRIRKMISLFTGETLAIVEVKRWWWPFWTERDRSYDFETARQFANCLRHPEITEVK